MKQKLILFLLFISCFCLSEGIAQTGNQITGKVTDSSGELIGVTVVVKGTSIGITTDLNGEFKLDGIKPDNILRFSFVGYKTKEIKVGNKRRIDVKLEEDSQQLEEVTVVAVGYGDVRRRDLTGSISKANMDDLVKTPVNNVAESLGGRIAGVRVTSSDGSLGDNFDIVIRGAGSLTQSTAPLYVIDGFPQETSGFSALNPNDIASIDILKDASATAIYGSRGANGVVIVTTKQGLASKPKVTYNGSITFGTVNKTMDMMNGYDFVLLQQEIMSPDTFSKYYLKDGIGIEDYRNFKNYDWQDEIYRTAVSHNHYVGLNGGSDKMKYSASLSYSNQQGVVINTDLTRYQGRFNFSQQINSKVKVNASANFASNVQNGVSTSSQSSSMTHSLLYSVWGYRPVSPSGSDLLSEMYDEDIDMSSDYRFNPVLSAKNEYRRNTTNHLQANLGLEWEIIRNLKFKTTAGYTGRDIKKEEFNGSKTKTGNSHPNNTQSRGINAKLTQQATRNYLNENTLTYQFNKNKHSFNALLGLTFQKYSSNLHSIIQTYINNESLGMAGIGRSEAVPTVSSSIGENSMMSYFTRFNYNYNSKYYANFTIRADGSSKFAPGNRWGYFPSASLAWTFSREDFIKDNLSFLSNGKIRVSWGLTGNNRIGDYDYMPQLMTHSDYYKYPWDSSFSTGFVLDSMGNPSLRWETTEQYDLGLDLGLFNGRLNITMDYYEKTAKDLLLKAEVPASSGYTTATMNIGKLKNTGMEITLESVNIKTKDFTWSSNFNIAFNKNKIVALNSGQNEMLSYVKWDYTYQNMPAYISGIGEPAGQIYGYIYEGTYKYSDFNQIINSDGSITYKIKDDIPRISEGVQPGDPKYKKLTNDGTNRITDADRTIIGNGQPKHTGGFTNNFTYKNWDLNIFLQWSYGNDVLNANRMFFENPASKTNTNMFATYKNRWTPDNPESNIPRAKALDSKYYSSLYVEDASFLKLKSISLGYNLSKETLKKIRLQALRLYFSAENIATITGYSGSDPEVSVQNSVLTPGFDWSSCPRSFNASFGVNITF